MSMFPDDGALPAPAALFAGGSEMSGRIRAFDWARTPLGPVAQWPQSLKTAVQIMLNSRYPMFVWWGRDLINFYNDAYIPVLGARHPHALGRSARDVWAEIWDVLGPQAELVLNEGRATWNEDLLLVMERKGYTEETYFTFSYSPAPNDAGGPGGVFCACMEETTKVLSERRLHTLRTLSEQVTQTRATAEVCAVAAQHLAANPHDLPFALLYLLAADNQTAQLCGATRLAVGTSASPAEIVIADGQDIWPFQQVIATGKGQLVGELAQKFGALPGGAWPESAQQAVVLPLTKSGQDVLAGFLVAGLSPRLAFDNAYHSFTELVAGHIATALANAQAYEEEKKRAEALAELDRAKTVFFSNISHELRTPLTLMLGPAEDALADTREPLSPTQRERIAVLQRNSLRLLKLVNTLLDFSRIEAGRIDASYEAVDLSAFTCDLASVFRATIEKAGVQLTVDCPPLSEAIYVDRDMWEKIVLNLLSNAFKFTFAGQITVALQETADAVALTVRDTGTGMPADELPHVFERFHRVRESRGRTHEGTGIGLALVQELVKLHGGTVTVASELGVGSTFTVTLPKGTAHLPQNSFQFSVSSSQTDSNAWTFDYADGGRPAEDAKLKTENLPRVLLAEDNADMREYVRRLLQEHYEVEAVADGQAALAAAQARVPDLLLTDVMMPRLDGFGLLAEMRKDARTQDVPVVMLSARAGEEARIEGREAGADDYLVKPFTAKKLLARVEANLKVARVRREGVARLRESEERFAKAFNASPLVLTLTSLSTGKLLEVNETFVRVTGYSRAEAIGRTTDELGLWQRQERAGELSALVRDGQVRDAEYRFRLQDGTEIVGLLSAELLELGGEPCALTVIQDITERKRAEAQQQFLFDIAETIRRAEQSTDLLYDVAQAVGEYLQVRRCLFNEIDLARDRETVHRDYCHGVASVAGVHRVSDYSAVTSAAMAAGHTVVNRDAQTDPRTAARYEQVYAPAGERAYVAVPLLRDGRWVASLWVSDDRPRDWSELEINLLETVAERAWLAVEKLRGEQSLRESEERLRLATAAADMFSWETDYRAQKIVWSENAAAVIGCAPEALPTDSEQGLFFVLPADRARLQHELAQAVSARQATYLFEFRGGEPESGRKYWVAQGTLLYDEQGALVRSVGVTQNVTKRKRAEAERERLLVREQELRQTAEQANRLKDEFLATVSHELRTPLTSILGWAALLRRNEFDAAMQARALETIERNAHAQHQIIADLLEVSRIITGKLRLETVAVELVPVIEAALDVVRPAAAAKSIHLRAALDPAVGVVAGDANRLQQVVWNLLTNAVKFTPPGGLVEAQLAGNGAHAEITVRDNGDGIEPDFLPYVFDRFRQADGTTKRAYGGLGLGLAIVRHLVEAHGGTAHAASAGKGHGATFTIKLPLLLDAGGGDGASHLGATERAPLVAPPHSATDALAGVNVLLVDDDVDARHLLATLLTGCGAEVAEADSVATALTLFQQRKPDVLLSDIGMPEADGYDLIRRVRALERRADDRPTPAVALTAYARADDRARALAAGYAVHLPKPVEPAVVIQAIAKLAGKAAAGA